LSSNDALPEIPFAISGRGIDITEKITKPLLNVSTNYDRVTGFFSPTALLILIEEFVAVWKSGGAVRLIMGFHDQNNIFDAEVHVANDVIQAVSLALRGQVEEIGKLLSDRDKEVISQLCTVRALQVRLAIPTEKYHRIIKNGKWDNEGPIFHSKFAIFHHEKILTKKQNLFSKIKSYFSNKLEPAIKPQKYQSSNSRLSKGKQFTVVTGSQNDSRTAFTGNVEDAIVHRSAKSNERRFASFFVDRFEDLWWKSEELPEVVLVPFNSEFLKFMDDVTNKGATNSKTSDTNPTEEENSDLRMLTWKKFYENTSSSPIYHPHLFPKVGLLPHQMNVYREILSRWPIRGIIADEVGLGKTIEAGSIIDYCRRFLDLKQICIITPAALVGQWQNEMKTFFDMDFAIYHSTKNQYESLIEELPMQTKHVFADETPELKIISWHYLRSKSVDKLGENLPELLIVDESHNARTSGDGKPTQFLNFLKELRNKIPHILLLTATPYQTKLKDMQDLLELVGLPPEHGISSLEKHVAYISSKSKQTFESDLERVYTTHSSLLNYAPKIHIFNHESLKNLSDIEFPQTKRLSFYAKGRILSIQRELVILCHPTNLLMARNTREQLKQSGYIFPLTHLHGSSIKLSADQIKWFELLESYLCNHHQMVEERAYPTQVSIGFNRNNFRLRVVSSIDAAIATLESREKKLKEVWMVLKKGDTLPGKSDKIDEKKLRVIKSSAELESSYLNEVLVQLKRVFVQKKSVKDPKLAQLELEVKKYLSGKNKILIFSQYTATTKAVMRALSVLGKSHTIGRYDGNAVGIYDYSSSNIISKTKEEMKAALKNGDIEILICSNMASEGLNLQTASVVINVDIPYNPAVLMQRFGRVDRLGQKSSKVHLVNLYYPGTVEDNIFSALARRWDELVAVTGSAPKILDEVYEQAIRNKRGMEIPIDLIINEFTINDNNNTGLESITNSLVVDMDEYLNASPKKWFIEKHAKWMASFGEKVKTEGHEVTIDKQIYSYSPTDNNFLQWSSTSMEEILSHHLQLFEDDGSLDKMDILTVVDENYRNIGIIGRFNSKYYPFHMKNWTHIMEFTLNCHPIQVLGSCYNTWEEAMKEVLVKDQPINHMALKTIYLEPPKIPSIGNLRIGIVLGYIPISESATSSITEEE